MTWRHTPQRTQRPGSQLLRPAKSEDGYTVIAALRYDVLYSGGTAYHDHSIFYAGDFGGLGLALSLVSFQTAFPTARIIGNVASIIVVYVPSGVFDYFNIPAGANSYFAMEAITAPYDPSSLTYAEARALPATALSGIEVMSTSSDQLTSVTSSRYAWRAPFDTLGSDVCYGLRIRDTLESTARTPQMQTAKIVVGFSGS